MGWEVYLAYSPGKPMSNFATSPLVCAVASGQSVACKPPIVRSTKGGEVPREERLSVVLGILIGEEQWKDRKTEKVRGEQRRYLLVVFEGASAPCLVTFDQVSQPKPDALASFAPS
eukprot:1170539-Pleurochrysis_carterae.AAC.1